MEDVYPGRIIIKEGLLDKWCIKLKRWRSKFVAIELRRCTCVLSYYKANLQEKKSFVKKLEKDIILKGVQIFTCTNNPLVFKLKTSSTSRKYRFRARTVDLRNEWTDAFKSLINGDNKIISELAITSELDSVTFNDDTETCTTSTSSYNRSENNILQYEKFKAFYDRLKLKKKDVTTLPNISKKLASFPKTEKNAILSRCSLPEIKANETKTAIPQNNNHPAFNTTDLIAKKLKKIKILSKNISSLHKENIQEYISTTGDNNLNHISNLFEQHDALTDQIDDIFHKFMSAMHREDLVDFLNNYYKEYNFKLDELFYTISLNETSYPKIFSLIWPIISQNTKFTFSDIPIIVIKPKPLTELISIIFAQPVYLYRIVQSKERKDHVKLFTTYLARCLQELISNKYLHVGWPLLPIPNEYFSGYFTDKSILNFRVYVYIKCISLNPLRLVLHVSDHLYEFDLECNLVISMSPQSDFFDASIRLEGIFTLWNPEDTLNFSTSCLKLLYNETNVIVELIDNISIQSTNNHCSSLILLEDIPSDNSNEITSIFDDHEQAFEVKSTGNRSNKWFSNFTNYNPEEFLTRYENGVFISIVRFIMMIAYFLLDSLYSLISYDSILGSYQRYTLTDNNDSLNYASKTSQTNLDLDCTIQSQPLISCIINHEILDNSTNSQYDRYDRFYSSIDAFNETYYKTKSKGISCYVMESTNPMKEQYSSATLWANVITCLENKDKENFLRELDIVEKKFEDSG